MKRPPRPWVDRLGEGAVRALGVFALAILVLPSMIIVVISFDTRSFTSFPPQGLTLHWYRELLANATLTDAMGISAQIGVLVTLLCLALGVPTALACARGRFRGRGALSVFVLFPHMVPGVVLGIAVLFAGALVDLRPSVAMQVVAVSCFILAVMVRVVMARLARLDIALDEASANLGASAWQTLRHVTLPLLLPALFAGAAFTFIEGFDNISVAIFTHGYRDRPLAVELLSLVQSDNTPMVAAVSSLQIGLATAILAVVSLTIGLERVND
jgi:putative spermidine/putrescine transport system permease protein